MPDELASEHRFVPERGDESAVATSVVVSVAAVAGVEPLSLPPLQQSIDTDALEAVVGVDRARGADVTVRFTYAGYRVTVEADGSVRIGEPVRRN